MELKELYEKYGELSIRAEVVTGQMMEIKKQIINKLNDNMKIPVAKQDKQGGK